MSQQKTRASDGEESQEKSVHVVAYATYGAFKSERDLADSLDPDTDYYDRERKKTRNVELVMDNPDGDPDDQFTQRIYQSEIRDELVEHGVNSDVLKVAEEVEVTRPYAHSPQDAVREIRKEATADLPDNLAGGLECRYGYKWQDENWESLVTIHNGKIDSRRILLHQSERDGRRRYETERKHLSVQFRIELGPATEDLVSDWSETVVTGFVSALNKLSWVHRVRVADCTTTVSREGDCFNIT